MEAKMFDVDEWSGLISQLINLTRDNHLKWSAAGTELSVDINNTTYLISAKDFDDQPPWVLAVRVKTTDGGQEIDRIVSQPYPPTAGKPETLVSPLREAALRNAFGGPDLVKQLLADLNALNTTPDPF
jgi:hypothetical protein